ncbi:MULTISPECIES: hypothetical protein [unclassified Crossiella]|uniref:hypothetical protein n=1 Tax=unclassified Crossiella TaxID=2620835 RepID=UPI0020004C5C|nr:MULTISPECIES: hypothetical protein [unclassified Crossiella]MCK2245379.1 hypothetical protein [Crossiella sp. S99.2]MCK2259034.1 hypothetical protein [Crossiella sp. S99.1]
MSWNDFYRRRDVINAVLRQAERTGDPVLPFEDAPHAAASGSTLAKQVSETFADRAELLAALHYRWMLRLTGHLELALHEHGDRVEAATSAWQRLAAEEPTLRRLLDAGAQTIPAAIAHEQRTLALVTGLADAREPAEQIERVGAAFLALARDGARPTRCTSTRNFFRGFAASA